MFLPSSSEVGSAGPASWSRFIFQGFNSRFFAHVQEAVDALKALPPEAAEWIVLAALRCSSRRVRRNAATALAHVKSEAAMLVLLDLLREDRTLYFSAQQALATNSSAQVAARTAGYSRAPFGRNRKLFAMLLGELEPDFSFPVLLTAVTSTHATLREGALNAFRYGHPGLRSDRSRWALLQSLQEKLRPGPIAALGFMKAPEIVSLAERVFSDPASGADVRLAAARALADVGTDAAALVLLAPLQCPRTDRVGDAVAEALRRIKSPVVVEVLMAALDSSHASVRWRACAAIEYCPAAAARLRTLVRRDPDIHVRRTAARILGELRDAPSWNALLEAVLRDTDRYVRWNAAWALGRIGHGQAVPDLVRALQSGSPWLRQLAAEALGAYGLSLIEFPAAMEGLAAAAGDIFPFVARSAAWALRQVDLSVGLRLLAASRASHRTGDRVRAHRADHWLQPRFASYAPHFPFKSSRVSGVSI